LHKDDPLAGEESGCTGTDFDSVSIVDAKADVTVTKTESTVTNGCKTQETTSIDSQEKCLFDEKTMTD
jgi:hypothetical protein